MKDKDLIKIILSILLFGLSFVFVKIKIILLVISYIIISYEIYINAFKNILKGEIFDENLLMIVATIGAFIIKEYPEAVMVMLLFEIGEYLSEKAVDKSKKTITDLMDLRSDYANIFKDNEVVKVDAKTIKLDDIFIVKPGEIIPLDGIIVDGISSVDTSSLTGESVPRKIKINDIVLSGFINNDSIIKVKATSIYETSTASTIIELIENSNDKKTETEKFITKFCKIYTPVVIGIGLLIVLIPTLMGLNFNDWLYKALIFLVSSCPCALVISVPLSFFASIGRAGKEGVLVKGSNELDNLSKIESVVFDKTGTLTEGVFEVTDIHSINLSSEEISEYAAYSEYYSNHPIAKSILKEYGKKINPKYISDFKEISGKGITVKVNDTDVIIGNEKLMEMYNIDFEKVKSIGTTIYIVIDNKYSGYIIISDRIKESSFNIVNDFKNIGVNDFTMLTGDNKDVVSLIGKKLNIKNIYTNLLPIDKVEKVKEIKKNTFTAFIGDGINDAPVMKIADISISMGGIGSDAAINASDVVLMKDDLNSLIKAIKISKKNKKIIKFNIIFCLVIKILVLILGLIGISTIWMAVFADVGVTILTVLNSLRILKIKL